MQNVQNHVLRTAARILANQMPRRMAVRIRCIDVAAEHHQALHHRHQFARNGQMQRRVAGRVAHIDVRFVREQRDDALEPISLDHDVQRRLPLEVDGVHVTAAVDQLEQHFA